MTRSPAADLARKLLSEKHFVIATVILLTGAAGWSLMTSWIGLTIQKEGVAWPEAAVVSREDFRLRSLPLTTGPFEAVPGSDQPIDAETLEQLKIATAFDEMRYDERKSNWYVRRVYEDTSADDPAYRLWYIDVFFYNGGTDTVPHIPERCRTVAGVRDIHSNTVTMDLPRGPRYWSEEVPFRRIDFVQGDAVGLPDDGGGLGGKQRVEYYTFSFNGKPEEDWEIVRLNMATPWISHAYFAKIQFGPLSEPHGIGGLDAADRRARRFMDHVLPEILKNLPTPEDVERAKEAG